MNPTPPTIFELCDRATSGPYLVSHWKRFGCLNCDGEDGYVDTTTVNRKTGENSEEVIFWVTGGHSLQSNAQLIARLSPDVVRKVAEALERIASMDYSCEGRFYAASMSDDADAALRLLNGLPIQPKGDSWDYTNDRYAGPL